MLLLVVKPYIVAGGIITRHSPSKLAVWPLQFVVSDNWWQLFCSYPIKLHCETHFFYMLILVVRQIGSACSFMCSRTLCSLGWNWSWWLEWCERKILLAGWWLEADVGAV
jgi:hypothetical protein